MGVKDTIRSELQQFETSLQQREFELRRGVILDLREVIIKEVGLLELGLDKKQISDLSERLAGKIEEAIIENEERRTDLMKREISSGFDVIQNKVNEALVELESRHDDISRIVEEKIESRQEADAFKSQVREDRQQLVQLLWKNIEDEFSGELEKGIMLPRERVLEILLKKDVDEKTANELSSEFVTVFVSYLQNALAKMQSARFENPSN